MSAITTSPEINEIAEAIAKAQATLENVTKSGKNPHFKSSYAVLPDVLAEVRPKFAEQGVAIIQMPVNGEQGNIGVATRFAHKSGQWIESVIFVAPTKFDAQGVGSVQSYLRRYSLMAMAGVGADDDDGEAAVGRPAVAQPRGYGNAADADTQKSRDDWNTRKPAAVLLPPSPEEPPEIAEDRKRIRALIDRLAERIKTAPDEHRLEVIMDDARSGDLKEIEASGPKGIEAANALRARYNVRISELRGKVA